MTQKRRKPLHKRPIWTILLFDLTLIPWLQTISKPFTARKPWAAAFATFVSHPIAGMFYLGRWKRALFYTLLTPCFILLEIYLLLHVENFPNPPVFIMDAVFLRLIGSIDAYFIARSWQTPEKRQWFTRWYVAIGLWLLLSAGLFGGYALGRVYVADIYSALGDINKPTLMKGDFFLLYRHPEHYKRGDIALLEQKIYGAKRSFFWRVIGLPGDVVKIEKGIIEINGKKSAIHYKGSGIYQEVLPGKEAHDVYYTAPFDMGRITVPEGSYFLLSDNRDMYKATDFFSQPQYINTKNLKGKILFICTSPCPLDTKF